MIKEIVKKANDIGFAFNESDAHDIIQEVEKHRKECPHEWEWTFVVDCADLTCKYCDKDVFELYEKDTAIRIINNYTKKTSTKEKRHK